MLPHDSPAVTDGAFLTCSQVNAKEGIIAVYVLYSLDHVLMLCCRLGAQGREKEHTEKEHTEENCHRAFKSKPFPIITSLSVPRPFIFMERISAPATKPLQCLSAIARPKPPVIIF